MLREISSTRQNNNHKLKRWFTDANMDLFIWFKDQVPVCFQFSYKDSAQEHAISWHINHGFDHSLVRSKNYRTQYRLPASTSTTDFNPARAARAFLQASDQIETTLADFIFARLLEYPGIPVDYSDQALVS